MRSWILYAFVLIFSAGMVVSCSTPEEAVEFDVHPDGWNSPTADNFHGKFVLDSQVKTDNCVSCHGADLKGIPAKDAASCFACHASYPHPDGFATETSSDFHTVTIAAEFWDLASCQDCHGSNYAGEGFAAKSCLTCHTADEGPEACYTCHGDYDVNIAPPEALNGSTDTSSPGVGAHQFHLGGSAITDILTLACTHCHAEVHDFDDADHITGDGRAALVFSQFATSDGALTTTYDPATQTCSNVYCHGDFEFLKSESASPFIYSPNADAITGNNASMVWTDVGIGAAACGTCHGLPPTGHNNFPTCSNCHGSVVNANNEIIDTSKHINGEIDLF